MVKINFQSKGAHLKKRLTFDDVTVSLFNAATKTDCTKMSSTLRRHRIYIQTVKMNLFSG